MKIILIMTFNYSKNVIVLAESIKACIEMIQCHNENYRKCSGEIMFSKN